LGNTASSAVQSGASDLDRGLSESVQSWETDESQWPVSQPVEKTEAKVQCSGEAQYVNDIPSSTGEVHAAFVLSQRGNCDIDSVKTDAALVCM
jgi:xanthine dehydrogenase/oxidase